MTLSLQSKQLFLLIILLSKATGVFALLLLLLLLGLLTCCSVKKFWNPELVQIAAAVLLLSLALSPDCTLFLVLFH